MNIRAINKLKIQPQKNYFEIFAYCSKNYKDAYDFVIDSWTKLDTVTKITLYTDWEFTPNNPKIEVIKMFDEDESWIVGTGRRLDVIKHFSYKNKGTQKNVLFLDIDCYIVKDVSEIFNKDFDIAISRLNSCFHYANKTATAGLWFCKLSDGYYNFIEEWFSRAQQLKNENIGLDNHRISYVQYSFTDVAKTITPAYKVLAIDEKIYNSEHSILDKWYDMIQRYKPKILHFKGQRFRDSQITKTALRLSDPNQKIIFNHKTKQIRNQLNLLYGRKYD